MKSGQQLFDDRIGNRRNTQGYAANTSFQVGHVGFGIRLGLKAFVLGENLTSNFTTMTVCRLTNKM